jgi:hypothetical protein
MSTDALRPITVPDDAGIFAPGELDRTHVSLFVATERSLDPRVASVVDRVRTGHFATRIDLSLVSQQLLSDVIAVETPLNPVDILLEEVLAGETGIIVQFVEPGDISDELTRLETRTASPKA